jgi:asparagine synthase (glutamine-hydrolysing)
MCGIAGLLGSIDVADERLEAMLTSMKHRGPDGHGRLHKQNVAVGMVRLALVDPNERSQQPIWLSDKKQDVAILLNGEIYNFKEERTRLEARGHRFRTQGDAEVALHAYLDDENGFLQRMRGMFAIAICDFRPGSERVLLARDPFGMKPLYITRAKDADGHEQLAFASEAQALLAGGVVDGVVSATAISTFLHRGYVPQDQCTYHGVEMLPAGEVWRWQQSAPLQRRQFYLATDVTPGRGSLAEHAAELRHVLEESVRLHAFADVPVGAFLSGGVDSAAVVGLMRAHLPKLQTFTLSFPDVAGADEGSAARATAQHLDVPITSVDVRDADVSSSFLRFAAGLDQPSADGFNTWLVARGAAPSLRGVLSGLGGDEWFSGYPVAQRMQRMHTQQRTAGRLVQPLASLTQTFGASAASSVLPIRVLARRDAWASRRSLGAHWWYAHSVASTEEAQALTGTAPRLPAMHIDALMDPLALCMQLDVQHYMKDQLLRDSDVTSMQHSLELRTPFVDVKVAEFAARLPHAQRIVPGKGAPGSYAHNGAKRVLLEALRDVLPPALIHSPKRGFTLPYRQWMQGVLHDRVDGLQERASWRRGVLLEKPLAAWAQSMAQARHHALAFPRLWSVLVLDAFLQALPLKNPRFKPLRRMSA